MNKIKKLKSISSPRNNVLYGHLPKELLKDQLKEEMDDRFEFK